MTGVGRNNVSTDLAEKLAPLPLALESVPVRRSMRFATLEGGLLSRNFGGVSSSTANVNRLDRSLAAFLGEGEEGRLAAGMSGKVSVRAMDGGEDAGVDRIAFVDGRDFREWPALDDSPMGGDGVLAVGTGLRIVSRNFLFILRSFALPSGALSVEDNGESVSVLCRLCDRTAFVSSVSGPAAVDIRARRDAPLRL